MYNCCSCTKSLVQIWQQCTVLSTAFSMYDWDLVFPLQASDRMFKSTNIIKILTMYSSNHELQHSKVTMQDKHSTWWWLPQLKCVTALKFLWTLAEWCFNSVIQLNNEPPSHADKITINGPLSSLCNLPHPFYGEHRIASSASGKRLWPCTLL